MAVAPHVLGGIYPVFRRARAGDYEVQPRKKKLSFRDLLAARSTILHTPSKWAGRGLGGSIRDENGGQVGRKRGTGQTKIPRIRMSTDAQQHNNKKSEVSMQQPWGQPFTSDLTLMDRGDANRGIGSRSEVKR
jgi:hypothetical protein